MDTRAPKAKKYEIHPIADIFPMMSDDELSELAEDIKTNGLIHPIVTKAGVIIDGRNRLRACEIAGIAPEFVEFETDNIEAFIVSVNLARRNLTKGQQAMALAMIYPEPARGRGKTDLGKKGAESASFSYRRIAQARQILRSDHDLAQSVLAGVRKFDDALADIEKKQGTARNENMHLRELRKTRPDLADAIIEETLTLEEALQKAKQDDDEEKQLRWTITTNLIDGIRALDRDPAEAEEVASMYDASVADKRGEAITLDRMRRVGDFIQALIEAMEKNA